MTTLDEKSTQQVADELVKLCREGKFAEATASLYGENIVSVEAMAGPDGSKEMKGLAAVKAKGEWWSANHEVLSSVVEGPLVAGTHFSVTFKMELTHKPTGRRFSMEEIAVYQVDAGKVIYEQFFYKTPGN